MAPPRETLTPAWSTRLATDLTASDQTARNLISELTNEQLNWKPSPGRWSVGQCLEHLCIANEAYLPPISAALKDKPDSPVEQIAPGWFGRWFIRSFIEPTPDTRRVSAPRKIRPTSRVGLSVLDRFVADNQAYRDLILSVRYKNVNQIRFWNPFVTGLRFTVGTGFQIIVSHERRHLLQAQCVRDSAEFPG